MNFANANILGAKLQIGQYDIKGEDIAIGIFREMEVSKTRVPKVNDSHHD